MSFHEVNDGSTFVNCSEAWCGYMALGGSLTPRRFFVYSGAPPAPVAPAASVAVHGVSSDVRTGGVSDVGFFATKGRPFLVETGGAYSSGVALKTDSSGRAIAQGGRGTIVATSLEARSEEHTSGLLKQFHLVCRLLLEKKKKNKKNRQKQN